MSREFRVTTERLVEADTAAEAAALSARIRPDEWVVYSDDYKVVTVVTVDQVIDAQRDLIEQAREWGEIVDAEIVEDDTEPLTMSLTATDVLTAIEFDRTFADGDTFTVEIDPGEFI